MLNQQVESYQLSLILFWRVFFRHLGRRLNGGLSGMIASEIIPILETTSTPQMQGMYQGKQPPRRGGFRR